MSDHTLGNAHALDGRMPMKGEAPDAQGPQYCWAELIGWQHIATNTLQTLFGDTWGRRWNKSKTSIYKQENADNKLNRL